MHKRGQMPLKEKQEAFCLEYIKDYNATQAAIRAGYSQKTARTIGQENLTKLDISNRIKELQGTYKEDVKAEIERIKQELRGIAFTGGEDEGIDKKKNKDGEILEVSRKDKLKALELLGKHYSMFTERVALQNPDGSGIFDAFKDVADGKLTDIAGLKKTKL
jgi:phage terminase small subunit